MDIWIWWLVAALALTAVEVITTTVWALCFALGCLAGMVAALCGATFVAQTVGMAVVSVLACIILLPRLKRLLRHDVQNPDSQTNADAMIGRQATVTQTIAPGVIGRVRIDGVSWQAVADDTTTTYDPGQIVTIKAVNSIILTIK